MATRSHTVEDAHEQVSLIAEAQELLDDAGTPTVVKNARLAVIARRLEASIGKGAVVELMVGRGNAVCGIATLALFCSGETLRCLRMSVMARLNFVARTFGADRTATVSVEKNRYGAQTYCPRDAIAWTPGFEFEFVQFDGTKA